MKLWIEEDKVEEFNVNNDDNYQWILKNKRENIYLNSVINIRNNDYNLSVEKDDYHLDDKNYLDNYDQYRKHNVSHIKDDKLDNYINNKFKLEYCKYKNTINNNYYKLRNKHIRSNHSHNSHNLHNSHNSHNSRNSRNSRNRKIKNEK